MEEEGIVSIWFGSFDSEEDLASYAEARFKRDEEGKAVQSFTQDFFDGDLWPFEPEMFDYEMTGPSADPEAAASPLGAEIAAAVAQALPQGLDQPYNAVLAVYDYQFEGSGYVPGAPARFAAAVPYFKD